MKDLAPEITRQRLLMEGYYTSEINHQRVEEFLSGIAAHLNLRTYGKPIIHAPEGLGKAENQGYDAFIPLIDSGISLYVWSSKKFFAVVLFTCKIFDKEQAVQFTKNFFQSPELEFQSF
ncbi:MAG: S-adenosylmethionine decarboxylase [Spirochaetes bacterium]|nr:S-adenosylmethionine decarboxylase [Spirochaetota bacterium]